MGTGTNVARGEKIRVGTVCDAFFGRPNHRILIVAARRNIVKFAGGGNLLAVIQLFAAALAIGVAGVALLGAGGVLFIFQLCAAVVACGINCAVCLPADRTDCLFMAVGGAAGAVLGFRVALVVEAGVGVGTVAVRGPFGPAVFLRILLAIFFAASLTGCRARAVRFAAVVRRFTDCRAAALAYLPVLCFSGFPFAGLDVGMGIPLTREYRQGSVRRGEIFAFVCPGMVALSAVIDEQLQHRAVGKFRNGFGCGVRVRVAEIVAVGGLVHHVVAYDFTGISFGSDFADLIAVGNRSAHTPAADTAGVGGAGDFADVIAIADDCQSA